MGFFLFFGGKFLKRAAFPLRCKPKKTKNGAGRNPTGPTNPRFFFCFKASIGSLIEDDEGGDADDDDCDGDKHEDKS